MAREKRNDCSADFEGTVTVGDWLAWAKKQIDSLEAEIIATHLFSMDAEPVDRSWLVAHSQDSVDLALWRTGKECVIERKMGVPIAYVVMSKEFYGRSFSVTPEVLIPRPETEVLIDLVKDLPLSPSARILEVGTGSGCIAVTLALEFPQATVVATDVDEEALEIAKENDREYEGRIFFVETDLLDGINDQFDVVVANLPYVDAVWPWLDLKALSYEPYQALFAQDKGLALYKKLMQQLSEKGLSKYLVIEADPCQQDELVAYAEKCGFELLKAQDYGLIFVFIQKMSKNS